MMTNLREYPNWMNQVLIKSNTDHMVAMLLFITVIATIISRVGVYIIKIVVNNIK